MSNPCKVDQPRHLSRLSQQGRLVHLMDSSRLRDIADSIWQSWSLCDPADLFEASSPLGFMDPLEERYLQNPYCSGMLIAMFLCR